MQRSRRGDAGHDGRVRPGRTLRAGPAQGGGGRGAAPATAARSAVRRRGQGHGPKIPFWAMGALSLLPIWMFIYVRSLTQETEEAAGPLGEGAEVYGSCASCHGAQR